MAKNRKKKRAPPKMAPMTELEKFLIRISRLNPIKKPVPIKLARIVLKYAFLGESRADSKKHKKRAMVVDGDLIRCIYPDFVSGGNPSRYPWVFQNMLLADSPNPAELPNVFTHEAIENFQMSKRYKNYDRAHDIANYREWKIRIRRRIEALRIARNYFTKVNWVSERENIYD